MNMHTKILESIPPSVRPYFPDPAQDEKASHQAMMKKLAVTFLLWTISKKPTTGYSLIKQLESEHPGGLATASRIYPFLAYMEEEGLIKAKILKTGKRESKEYSITAKGKLLINITRKIISHCMWGEFLRDISKK